MTSRWSSLDRLGFDEVWFGEHHGLGWETIGSPEIMIAAAAERTTRIKLGSGVISLPYHHPLLVAERLVLLDHLTRGRFIFGLGPGAFPSDATMMGLDYQENRERMVESLDAILTLLRSDEPVSIEGKGFTIDQGRLNLRPFSYPCFEMCVASVVSPTGPRLAGRYGLGLLSLAANRPQGWELLRDTWRIVEDNAKEHGQVVDRSRWRSVGFFHIADTEAQARRDVRFGIRRFCHYFNTLNPFAPAHPPEMDATSTRSSTTWTSRASRASAPLTGSRARSAGSSTTPAGSAPNVAFVHEMADPEATKASMSLMSSTVMPVFQGSTVRPELQFAALEAAAEDGAGSRGLELSAQLLRAQQAAGQASAANG